MPKDKVKGKARGAVSLVSEPFGLGVARAMQRAMPAQVRLSSREQQPRPPTPKKGAKRR